MATKTRFTIALCVTALTALGLMAATLGAQTGKSGAVAITGDPLPLKAGEEGVVTIHVVAQVDISRLVIAIAASEGVALAKPIAPSTFAGVTRGAHHEILVPVRLTAAYGFLSVSATADTAAGPRPSAAGVLVGAPPAAPDRVPAGTSEDLADLTLVKVSGTNAVVRFGQKSMLVVTKGDRLGKNRAEIIEIAPGLIVLDETFVDADGKPNRARVTLKEGEKGGTRVLVKPGEKPPLPSQVRGGLN